MDRILTWRQPAPEILNRWLFAGHAGQIRDVYVGGTPALSMGNMRSNRPLPLIFCRYCANWRRRQHDGLAAFSQTRLPVSRWRNGGGETREIISWPPGQADFDWRASIATVAQDGPFSAFPGIARSITLLSGEGMQLTDGIGVNHVLNTVGEPFEFSGDLALHAHLLGARRWILT
jgi:hypothetical protein